jgi:hypothetical protein
MGCAWDVHGVCMGCAWGVHGVCMGCAWGVLGVCTGCARGVLGVCSWRHNLNFVHVCYLMMNATNLRQVGLGFEKLSSCECEYRLQIKADAATHLVHLARVSDLESPQ